MGAWVLLTGIPWTRDRVCVCVLAAQPCPTLCHPMDSSPPGFSVHGILPRIFEWVAIPFSMSFFFFFFYLSLLCSELFLYLCKACVGSQLSHAGLVWKSQLEKTSSSLIWWYFMLAGSSQPSAATNSLLRSWRGDKWKAIMKSPCQREQSFWQSGWIKTIILYGNHSTWNYSQ